MTKQFSLSLSDGQLPAELLKLLFAEWVTALSSERLGLTGYGSQGQKILTFGDQQLKGFSLAFDEENQVTINATVNVPEKEITPILIDAKARAKADEYGEDLVYEVNMHAEAFQINPLDMLHMMRVLGDQRRITGDRRLSDRVLLEFSEEIPEGAPAVGPFPPRTDIKVSLFVPGPTEGQLSKQVSSGMAELVAATCALALGRVVLWEPVLFPADESKSEAAKKKRFDTKCLVLLATVCRLTS